MHVPHVHGRDIVHGLNARDKFLCKVKEQVSKNITTTFEGLGTLHSDFNRSNVSFSYQCKQKFP